MTDSSVMRECGEPHEDGSGRICRRIRAPGRDRAADKEKLLTEDNRKAALWMVDAWADLAQRKEEEATAAYALARQREEALDAMMLARNHCKQQTNDVSARLIGVKTWLRENHPEVYVTILKELG